MVHQFGPYSTARTMGSLHFMRNEPAYATIQCVSPECTAFSIAANDFKRLMQNSQSDVAEGVVYSLQKHVRSMGKIAQRTPLLRQSQKSVQAPIFATSVAAAVESFYRSGMNAYINAHLTGKPVAALFPHMHVQVLS